MKIRPVMAWLTRPPTRWAHLQRVPMRHLKFMMIAAFLLFSVIGFYVDIMAGGVIPYAETVMFAILSGLNAVLWILALARLPMICVLMLIVLEFFVGTFYRWLAIWADATFHPAAVPAEAGLHFAGTAILIVVISSYSFFSRYMGTTGREAFRIKNELELAHSIQKTLVPCVSRTTPSFDIYGISEPSEKVGGDLVDVVELPGGDVVAYLADIAGHGLQAGILMGMLKTAARMALTGGSGETAGAVLSMLMERLNVVLPQVKEAHMYATFTALRLNMDGKAFYGMAASTPLLHWKASQSSMTQIEEQQFPLGLLPVSGFPANALTMNAGDIVVIATDGILEVNSALRSERGAEFGIDALGALVSANANLPLSELAALILQTVRHFGKQADDQTLLIIRKLAI